MDKSKLLGDTWDATFSIYLEKKRFLNMKLSYVQGKDFWESNYKLFNGS